jgi:hypothetical protein
VGEKLKIISAVLAVLLLTGCSMRTLDELYRVPRRSEEYNNLQSAIDQSIGDREYCAPLSGENLQTVQMADLDGDGTQEYLLFAKGTSDKPLQILIFRLENEEYVLSDTIRSTGGAYDVVEYARMDDKPGYELIVGYQISDQVARSVSVYSFRSGKAVSLMSANYTKFVPYDINADGRSELMILHAGESDEASGVAELYYCAGGTMERSNQVNMSETVDRLKRIVAGKLHGGQPAIYVASAVGESAIITDVFAMVDGHFTNVSFSNESGTSVQTLRNYYVYADDIDEDGVVELPDLITMRSPANLNIATMQYLIRWYAMTASGDEAEKVYTYHNFQGGWYMTLDSTWAARVAVLQRGSRYEFYVWDEDFINAQKLLTVYSFTGADREEQSLRDNRFVLYKGDTVVYAAGVEVSSAAYGITPDTLTKSFHLIHQDWKTGET